MLRFSGERGNRRFIGIGLSELNVKRLKDGQPISQTLEAIGFPDLDIFITYGKTEDSIARQLEAESGQVPLRFELRTKEQRTRGFGKRSSEPEPKFEPQKRKHPLACAAELLHEVAQKVEKPVLIPMYPPGNEVGLEPGQVKTGHDEVRPSCDGIVAAVSCSAEEAQELFDLILDWQRKKVGGSDATDQ